MAIENQKTAYGLMVDKFDQLVYMVKTTAPHLMGLTTELRESIKAAIAEASKPTTVLSNLSPKS